MRQANGMLNYLVTASTGSTVSSHFAKGENREIN